MSGDQNQASNVYGQETPEESGYGGTGYGGTGYGGTGYGGNSLESPGYAADPNYVGESAASALGALNNPLVTQRIENPWAENVYVVNPFDNAYTETLTNANPQGPAYGDNDYGEDDQIQIEL